MNNWDQSSEQMNENSQKFATFFEDDEESENNEFKRQLNGRVGFIKCQTFEETLNNYLDTYDESHEHHKSLYNKDRQFESQKEQQKTQIDRKPKKSQKSGVYAKTYRQRKKQQVKILEQQNNYLKKKVNQLQRRLHQIQMQLNRFKFPSNEQFSMSHLSSQMSNKLKVMVQQPQNSNNNLQKKQQNEGITDDKQMQQFKNIFQTYGMGGTKSKQMLKYYIDQFIQSIMRDGEKYFILKWFNRRNKNEQKTKFDIELQQHFERTQQENKEGVRLSMQIRPVTLELLNACREIYKVYKNVINSMQKIHEILRAQLSTKVQYTQKRMKMVLWFQQNKYRKQIRDIRAEWLDFVKSQDCPWETQKPAVTKKKIVK